MNITNSCWLLSLAILECCCLASTESYPKEYIKEIESNLMSLFGFKGRPQKVDKSKIIVPEEIIRLYEMQNGLKFVTSNIPKKGAYLTSANTVRSFVHIGIFLKGTYSLTWVLNHDPQQSYVRSQGLSIFGFWRHCKTYRSHPAWLPGWGGMRDESPIDRRFQTSHKFRMKFDPAIPPDELFQHAELALSRNALHLDENNPYLRVIVEDILQPGRKGKHGPLKRVIESKRVDSRKNSTLLLDLTEAVQRWIQDPKTNHGVIVKVLDESKSHHIRLKRDINENERSWMKVQPVLYTYTDDKRNAPSNIKDVARNARRRKRAARKHGRRKDEHSPCSRHKMYVDFDDVGWSDWIVAPPGYDAYYCQGDCKFPLADHLNTTNHAIVQTLMNSMSPMTVPKACCVPTQLNSISMLYLDVDKKVVLKNYKEMVVIGCGCR